VGARRPAVLPPRRAHRAPARRHARRGRPRRRGADRIRLTPAVGAAIAALTIAACGADPSITSGAAQKACESGGNSAAAKSLTDEQKTGYCKCLLPKLEDAGFDKASDFVDAIKDEKGLAAIRDCAQEFLRGY
jgi:hypothetical protein